MRHTLRSLVSANRRFGKWSKDQLISLLITSVVFGFIFSFRMWGGPDGNWDALIGILNWFSYSVFSFISIFIMHFGIRFAAIEMGYTPEYKKWNLGLLFSVSLIFLTNGFAPIIFPGGYHVKTTKGMQIGKFFKGLIYRDFGYIVFWGFFSLVLYSLLVRIFLPIEISAPIISISFAIAFWSLFPVDIFARIYSKACPISNGTYLFFCIPWAFGIFTVAFLILSWFFIIVVGSFIAIFLSLFFAIIIYFIFYLIYDPTSGILR